MDTTILGPLLAAAIGAVTALITTYFTHRVTARRYMRSKLLEKLEQVLRDILVFSQLSQQLLDTSLDVATFSEHAEFDVEVRRLREARLQCHSLVRLQCSVYFPRLQSILDNLWTDIQEMDGEAMTAGSSNFSEQRLRESFGRMKDHVSKLRAACNAEARRLI